jgi:hypothetical protein
LEAGCSFLNEEYVEHFADGRVKNGAIHDLGRSVDLIAD